MSSPARIQRSSKSPSPKRFAEKEPTEEKNEKLGDGKLGKNFGMLKSEEATNVTSPESADPCEMDVDNQVDIEKNLKRPREDEIGNEVRPLISFLGCVFCLSNSIGSCQNLKDFGEKRLCLKYEMLYTASI